MVSYPNILSINKNANYSMVHVYPIHNKMITQTTYFADTLFSHLIKPSNDASEYTQAWSLENVQNCTC